MARVIPLRGKRLIKAIALAGMIEIMYLLAGNLLLNVAVVPQMLSRNPDHFKIEWSSGWTFLPGHLRINGLYIEGKNPERQWSFSISRSELGLAPWGLFSGTLQLQSLKLSGLTVAVKSSSLSITEPAAPPISRTSLPQSAPMVSQPESPKPVKITSTQPSPGQTKVGTGWTFKVSNAEIADIRQIEIDSYSFISQGRVQLKELTFGADGSLGMERGALQFDSGVLISGSQSIARSLRSDIELRIDRFLPAENAGPSAAGFVSGQIGVSGDLSSFGFLNSYFSEAGWLKLAGKGSLKANLLVDRGRLMEGSELSIDSSDLAVELDERSAADSGDRYRIRGTGRVQGDVRATSGGGETRLQVELNDIAMHTQPQDQLFLQGEAFSMLLTGPPVNFSEKAVEPAVRMQWREAEVPDVAVLNGYFPGETPFSLISGRARLNGYLAYADRVVSGMFILSGEAVSGTVFEQSVIGNLGVELHLKQADLTHRKIDLSGTRIEVETSSPAADDAGAAPLRTELTIVEGLLMSELPLEELKHLSGRPPLSGVLKIEGQVANIDFLSTFLADRKALEFSGGGVLRTDLRVSQGRLAPGSSLAVESDKLVSSFSGFTASGAGRVSVELQQAAEEEKVSLEMALHDMKLAKLQNGKLLLSGRGLQLIASSPPVDISKQHHGVTLEVKWQDALAPDLEILNGYLPDESPFSLSSGSARTSGHITFDGKRFSGDINLAGENITGMLLKEPVNGKLELDLVIKKAEPESSSLDLSGTRIMMQAASTATEKAPLETRISISEAKFEAGSVSNQSKDSETLGPFSGVVRLEGSVANIGFINSFLKGSQRLEFSGNGHLSADLHFLGGQVSPGSRLLIASGNLVSRFLDFEANGSGMIVGRIEGRPDAPVAKLESSLKNFGLHRLGESESYIRGRDFQITTVGRRFDLIEGLQNLDTSVRLLSAEIPDISVYNTYLPENSGVSIVSGKGSVTGEFRLKGVSGSGNLEMRAKGVEVKVRDQTIRGDLLISTRLTDGNLDEMIFDASGTRVRIENGSLLGESDTQAKDWWGQLDVSHGQMTWKRPLLLNAVLNLQLRDSGLLVHLFAKQKKQWLNNLLTINDVTGETKVLLNGESIVLRNVRIAGENLLVLADVHLSDRKIRGGMYARYGILRVGIELEDEDRTLKMLKPRQWYDSFSEKFLPDAR